VGIIKLNDLPDGSGSLTSDDIFLFMDNPSGGGITKKISLSQLSSAVGGGGGGISNLVEDITPQLGGNLDLNSYSINGTGSINLFGSGNFTQGLFVNNTGVSLSGHTHNSSDITDFNSSVSGLLPVKNVLGSGNISVTSSSQVFTISSSGLVKSDITGIAGASGVNNLVQISQVDYDALVSKDPNTVYFIV
jgi:hypothetical protein